MAIVAFASCGQKQVVVDGEDHDTAAVETGMDPDIAASKANQLAVSFGEKLNQHDKAGANNIAREAESTIVQLLLQGDTIAAKSYAQQFRKFFSDNSEKIKSFANGTSVKNLYEIANAADVTEFIADVNKVIDSDSTYQALKGFLGDQKKEVTKAATQTATQAASQAVNQALAPAKAAADAKVSAAKEKVEEAAQKVEAAKTATQQKVDAAKEKVTATQQKVDAAKESLKQKEEAIRKALQD